MVAIVEVKVDQEAAVDLIHPLNLKNIGTHKALVKKITILKAMTIIQVMMTRMMIITSIVTIMPETA